MPLNSSLQLTAEQAELLIVDMEIPLTSLWMVANNEVPIQSTVTALTNGFHLIFLDGTTEQHEAYSAAFFGEPYRENLVLVNRGISVYAGKAALFRRDELKVTVTTAS